MMSRFVLVTGAAGQLGQALTRTRAWTGHWYPIAFDRAALDLADPDAIARVVADGHNGDRWAAVVNAGAYTAVDRAEAEAVAAWTINALAPATLGEACRIANIPLIHVSTDYVFAGDKTGMWEVEDPVAPLGVYGASKLGGEVAVRASGARYAIVRTAWLVSAHGHNFVRTMLRLAAEHDTLRIVDDQQGSPTSADDLATALATIAMRLADDEDAPVGTFHFANAGTATWAEFAREIFDRSALRGGPFAQVAAIASADFRTVARRPANSTLSTHAICDTYGVMARPWTDALNDILDDMIGRPQ